VVVLGVGHGSGGVLHVVFVRPGVELLAQRFIFDSCLRVYL